MATSFRRWLLVVQQPDGTDFVDHTALMSYSTSNPRIMCVNFSPAGDYIAFAGQWDDSFTDLYVSSIDGTTLNRMYNTMPFAADGVLDFGDNGDCKERFQIVPDSTKIIYTADHDAGSERELFSANLDGTGRIRISQNFSSSAQTVERILGVSPDSSWVVYMADFATNNQVQVYSAAVNSASTNALLAPDYITSFEAGNYYRDFLFSDNSQRAFFILGDNLYSNNQAGSDLIKLNPNDVTNIGKLYKLETTQTILYFGVQNSMTYLFAVNMDGTNHRALTDGTPFSSNQVITSFDTADPRVVVVLKPGADNYDTQMLEIMVNTGVTSRLDKRDELGPMGYSVIDYIPGSNYRKYLMLSRILSGSTLIYFVHYVDRDLNRTVELSRGDYTGVEYRIYDGKVFIRKDNRMGFIPLPF
ncbi:MAG: hypothetical protein R2827_01320 [Bdellovibrionales bacterium]